MENRIPKTVIDFGCGLNKHSGAIGVDNVLLKNVDVVADLITPPYPFREECADEVILSHVLEHFDFPTITTILSEMRRILKPEGRITISVPHAGSVAAFTDPTHQTFFTFGSFHYLSQGHRFSYYKQIKPVWQVERIWASVNIANNQYQPEQAWQRGLNTMLSRGLSRMLRSSRTLTGPELLARSLPVWLVNIHVRLRKADHSPK